MTQIALRRAISRVLGLSMAGLIYGVPAHAQSTGDAPAVEPAALEEVVVTARKRVERLLDAPVAVTAFTGEALDRYGITSMNDVAEMTPGLVIGNTHNNVGGTIAIRGIGAATANSAIDQAVSVNIDGVQVSQGNFLRLGQFDLERVEVLKGPQSLFFGKNSTSGILSLTSRSPGDVFEGHVKGGYELSNERSYAEAAISGPVGDRFAARLFVFGAEQSGWFRNTAAHTETDGIGNRSDVKSAADESELAGRLTLAYGTTDDVFNARLKLTVNEVNRDNGPAAMSQKFLCPLGYSQASAESLTAGVEGDDDKCKIDRYWVAADPFPALVALSPQHRSSPRSEFQQTLASLEANWAFHESMKLTSVTGYYEFDQYYFDMYTNSNASLLASTSDYKSRQFTQELRLASDFAGRVNFMAGAFYQDADLEDYMTVAVGLPSPVLLSDVLYEQTTESVSVFGEITFDVLDAVDWSIGGRYTDEQKDLEGLSRGLPFTVKNDSITYNNFSLQSTLRYRPSDDSMLYFSYREGFIAGGYDFNPTPPALNENVEISYRESTVNGVEAGFKGTRLDGRLQFDATVFHYKYDDLQLAARDAVTLSLTTLNAGKATVQGAELGMQFRPDSVQDLVLTAQAAYTDATYDEFIASCWTGQSIAQGCNLRPNASGAFTSQDLAGDDLVRAPELTANLGALYDFSVGESFEASLGVNASYSSEFEATVENDARGRHDSYWLLNATFSLRSNDGRWEAALIGRNLTEELIRPNTFSSPLTGARTGTSDPVPSDLFGVVGSPREVAVELRYNF